MVTNCEREDRAVLIWENDDCWRAPTTKFISVGFCRHPVRASVSPKERNRKLHKRWTYRGFWRRRWRDEIYVFQEVKSALEKGGEIASSAKNGKYKETIPPQPRLM